MWVAVGVLVAVGVWVAVGVLVAVGVWVAVGDGVWVAVGDGTLTWTAGAVARTTPFKVTFSTVKL